MDVTTVKASATKQLPLLWVIVIVIATIVIMRTSSVGAGICLHDEARASSFDGGFIGSSPNRFLKQEKVLRTCGLAFRNIGYVKGSDRVG